MEINTVSYLSVSIQFESTSLYACPCSGQRGGQVVVGGVGVACRCVRRSRALSTGGQTDTLAFCRVKGWLSEENNVDVAKK